MFGGQDTTGKTVGFLPLAVLFLNAVLINSPADLRALGAG